MGTRHLICVVLDGDFRVAQYGQADGQPDGAGAVVVDFLRRVDLEAFKTRVRACRLVTRQELASRGEMREAFRTQMEHLNSVDSALLGGAKNLDFEDLEFARQYRIRRYLRPSSMTHLSRDCSAHILHAIMLRDEPGGLPLIDERGFAGNSASCEWAYVIDLDAGTLEIYEGFNRTPTPPGSRFPSGAGWLESPGYGYHPVRLVRTYDLSALPADFGAEARILQGIDDEDEGTEDADG